MGFDRNVFVNCPFDEQYLPLLRPILFSIIYLGFTPKISLESVDSGKTRIEKIVLLIKQSRYAIHDLSRLQAQKVGEFYRLNMPFELGIDIGCALFGSGRKSYKKCLILESEKYRYQAAISDLSNSDIAVHGNEPSRALAEVRNWLNNQAKLTADGPAEIWSRFNEFMADNYDHLRLRGFSDSDIANLPISELLDCIQQWVSKGKSRHSLNRRSERPSRRR